MAPDEVSTRDLPGCLHHMWSTLLHHDIWIFATNDQAFAARQAGLVAFSASEVAVLQDLRRRHADKELFGDMLRVIVTCRDVLDASLLSSKASLLPSW